MKYWVRLCRGIVRIRVTGYAPERFLNLCKKNNIELHNIRFSGNGYEMDLLACDVFAIKKLLKKTGTKIKIIGKKGVPFLLFRYRRHKFFALGIGFAFFCLTGMSRFLWDIDIQGNYEITDYQMLTYLEKNEIHSGIRLALVDCEQIEEQIRYDFPDIAWVSVRLEGTRIIMDIQELKTEISQESEDHVQGEQNETGQSQQDLGTDLIAGYDGVVVSIVTRKGTPAVRDGDEVKQGDLLVSGCNELYDDYGSIIAYEYCDADADVLIQAEETYQDVIDISYKKSKKTGKKRVGWRIFLPERQLSVGFLNSPFEHALIITEDHRVQIGEQFIFPIVIQTQKTEELAVEDADRTEAEIEEIAKEHFTLYTKKMDKKGFQILDKDGKITINAKQVLVTGRVQFQYLESTRRETSVRTLEIEEGLE